jgi:hypothetical protein
MLKFDAAAAIAILSWAFAFAPAASVAVTVKDEVPATVGVPEIVPDVLKARPAGSDPLLIVQVYGEVPPVAASAAEYGLCAVPPANVVVEIASGAGFVPPPPEGAGWLGLAAPVEPQAVSAAIKPAASNVKMTLETKRR